GGEMEPGPDLPGAVGQDLEKPSPADRREPMAAGDDPATGEVTDFDLAPAPEPGGELPERLRIRLGEVVEGLVREHDAEPVGVGRGVSLPNGDLVVGSLLSEQDRQIEARRSPADDRDPHVTPVAPGPP